jgi:hypothetical protein
VYSVITAKGLAPIKEDAPSHAQRVRRLFIDRLSPEQIDQLADVSTPIFGNLEADQPSL